MQNGKEKYKIWERNKIRKGQEKWINSKREKKKKKKKKEKKERKREKENFKQIEKKNKEIKS